MANENGGFDWAGNLRDLNEAARLNLDEHERIWKSIEILRDNQLAANEQVSGLVRAIRDLIERIPPENLR
jgi:hypothetical protein